MFDDLQISLSKYNEQIKSVADYKNQLLAEIKSVFFSENEDVVIQVDETKPSIDGLAEKTYELSKTTQTIDQQVRDQVINELKVEDVEETEFSYKNAIKLASIYRDRVAERARLQQENDTLKANIEDQDLYELYTIFIVWLGIVVILVAATIIYLTISDNETTWSLRLVTFILSHIIILYVLKNIIYGVVYNGASSESTQ